MMFDKKVCVIGLGYIGLPTAALLARSGFDVLGVDVAEHVVDTINQGRIHIVEPDLDLFVQNAVTSGKLKAYRTPKPSDIYMICVPTPFHKSGEVPQPNLDFVLAATRSIAPLLKVGDCIILESTSPVGTTEQLADTLTNEGVDVSALHIAYCPERVLPGKIMSELIENDRIVGGLTEEAAQVIGDFYRTFVCGEVLQTDARTAEMCKLTENSFRDVNIAFANELSVICAKEGIDVWKLIKLSNRHPRVNILQPGTGVGGHCIAVDPWFVVARNPKEAQLIRKAREVNNYKTAWVIEQIRNAATGANKRGIKKPVIACLGLAFKPDIDDLRESPAVHVVEALLREAFDVVVVEPNIDDFDRFVMGSMPEILEKADVIAILVRHKKFLIPELKAALAFRGALDFCGALE